MCEESPDIRTSGVYCILGRRRWPLPGPPEPLGMGNETKKVQRSAVRCTSCGGQEADADILGKLGSGVDTFVIEQFDSIACIPRAEWDCLAGSDATASHGWWLAVENGLRTPVRRMYLTARDTEGLAGAMVCRIDEHPGTWSSLDAVLFGRLAGFARRIGISAMPALVCGLDSGTSGPVLLRPALSEAAARGVAADLIDRAGSLASSRSWTVCFRSVAPSSAAAGLFRDRGYLAAVEMPVACLELKWNAFDDYRQYMRRVRPNLAKEIRWERNRGRRRGLAIEPVQDLAGCRDEVFGVMNAHFLRVGRTPFPFKPGFFESLKSFLGERMTLLAARAGGELLGVLLMVRSGECAHLPMIGVDRARGRAAAVYFNLGYNHPIEAAITAGCKRLYFGRSLSNIKRRRGCEMIERLMYLKAPGVMWNRALAALLPLRTWAITRNWA